MDTSDYKRVHRPHAISEKSGKPHQGIYVPKNPEKIVGGEIITRSSWETSFARWCDDNPDVVEWGCETIKIQYRNPAAVDFDACRKSGADPADPKNWPIHNYYPDFYIKIVNDSDNTEKRMMIEIKPKYQTERPIPPPPGAKLKDIKRYNELARVYAQNVKKWEAAKSWCDSHDIEFQVFTEVTLQNIGVLAL
jgi:hypothetical protein